MEMNEGANRILVLLVAGKLGCCTDEQSVRIGAPNETIEMLLLLQIESSLLGVDVSLLMDGLPESFV